MSRKQIKTLNSRHSASARTSPHFTALPRTSLHFLRFLWIGRLGGDQDVVFLLFALQKIWKDSASQPEIIKNTNRIACIRKSMRASHKFQIFENVCNIFFRFYDKRKTLFFKLFLTVHIFRLFSFPFVQC